MVMIFIHTRLNSHFHALVLFFAGNFSGPKQQEIVVAKGNVIELLRPDDTGKVISICLTPVFSVVRSLLAFRLAGKLRIQCHSLVTS